MLQYKEPIGKRDRRVVFQKKITALDESNSDAEVGWEDVERPGWWCNWSDNPGNEVMQAEQLVGVQVSALIGLTREVDLKWRVQFGGVGYNIISVQRLSRRYVLVLVKSGQQYVEQ